jgi:uncharacterized membrane protein YphA (DoxX/SURF4 family)
MQHRHAHRLALDPAQGIALLRIGLGVEFIVWAGAKVQDGWLGSGAVLAQVLIEQSGRAPSPYAYFLSAAVLPHIDLFAQLVTLGEWTAGLCLALGFITRLGAITGMWLTLNFMLMRGALGVDASIDRLFFLACLVCFLTPAGMVWGVDGVLHARSRVVLRPEPEANLRDG